MKTIQFPLLPFARRLLRPTLSTLQTLALLAGLAAPAAHAEVTVTNLTVAQRPGTKLVDITYDVTNTATNAVEVSLTVKNGATFIPTPSATGDIGPSVPSGPKRTIVWNGGADANGQLLQNVEIAVSAISAASVPDNYLVIDLSGGALATSYQFNYLSAVPAAGWTDDYKTTKLVLRRIPAGTFTMGTPSVPAYDEWPHEVTLTKDYYIGVFEVTQRQWELVMGTKPSWFNDASYYARRPVEQVSYYEIRENPANSDDPDSDWPANSSVNATSFMGKLRAKTGLITFDLPTEAQWEYACRAGTTTELNSGKDLTNRIPDTNMDEVGRYWNNGGSGYTQNGAPSVGTALVGSFLPNQWGLYDMHGNVNEWCLDWYDIYPTSPVTDPAGAAGSTNGYGRVMRGGSWLLAPVSSAGRTFELTPAKRHHGSGLRVCSGPPAQQ